MADLTADIEKRAKEFNAQPAEAKEATPQGPKVIEGNTGTLTVMLLNDVNMKLGEILKFIEEVRTEKV